MSTLKDDYFPPSIRSGTDEASAWDRYYAAAVEVVGVTLEGNSSEELRVVNAALAARLADMMLAERRKRVM